MQPQHKILKRCILPVISETFHQAVKFLRTFFIFLFKQIVDGIQPDQAALRVIPDPKAGIQIDNMKILADDANAESMQCTDGSLGQKVHLPS